MVPVPFNVVMGNPSTRPFVYATVVPENVILVVMVEFEKFAVRELVP